MSEYEVYALRYARDPNRRSSQNLLGGDTPDVSMPMDFFVWALVGPGGPIIVDTGFNEERGARRSQVTTTPVVSGLRQIGIHAAEVKDVLLTHLHWDHAGNSDLFPAATFHVQECEMQFCIGRCMCHAALRKPYDVEDVTHMIRCNFEGRLRVYGRSAALDDDISLHWVGGHTKGLQVVRVRTRRGWIVLASDAAHYYKNVLERRAFPLVVDLDDMLQGYETLRGLSDGDAHIIPGHDPLILTMFPRAGDGMSDVVRVDLEPLAA